MVLFAIMQKCKVKICYIQDRKYTRKLQSGNSFTFFGIHMLEVEGFIQRHLTLKETDIKKKLISQTSQTEVLHRLVFPKMHNLKLNRQFEFNT